MEDDSVHNSISGPVVTYIIDVQPVSGLGGISSIGLRKLYPFECLEDSAD